MRDILVQLRITSDELAERGTDPELTDILEDAIAEIERLRAQLQTLVQSK